MRLPVVPTLIVVAAMATMIALGFWQLQRKAEKEALLDQYRSASELPAIAFPDTPDTSLLYRRAIGFCMEPVSWRAMAGQNRDGVAGWQHIASCRTGGGEGPGMQVAIGWSDTPENPQGWQGGEVQGIIAGDREYQIRLVADAPVAGFEAVARPSPENLPNNHLMYAIQWFLFAGIAGVIYLLALRQRRGKAEPQL
jgi:cytochrome oxidase assembly protein ShyY1